MTLLVFCPPFNGRTFQIIGIFAQHDIDAIQEDLPTAQEQGSTPDPRKAQDVGCVR